MNRNYEEFQKMREMAKGARGLSPFEIKDLLISLAKDNQKKGVEVFLNAGRGNPNWTAATPRDAFFTLGHFAVEETRRVWQEGHLAGMPCEHDIYNRFKEYEQNHETEPGIKLLSEIIAFGIERYKFDPDKWVFELVDGIIGDNYPVPDRMLMRIEKIVHDYLIIQMGGTLDQHCETDLFAVEGGTAAMCYIFDSLIANRLLHKKSRIALMVPIFTPYLEIPYLPRYDFDVTYIVADARNEEGRHTWQYTKDELDKLKDSSIELLCMVNPSNPPSVAIDDESMEYIKSIVDKNNPDLMIITDDVYGTFAKNFKSFMITMPYNTLGVYSFSKYFGATGWRLGVIGLSKENVFNKRISELPQEDKEIIRNRYISLTKHVSDLSFIDRIVADSRQVALNHTAGLSTPQQVQMAFFAIFDMLDKDNVYRDKTREICFRRKKLVYDNLTGIDMKKKDEHSTSYYNEYDLLVWARLLEGEDFAKYLEEQCDPLEFIFELAGRYHIILLNGDGFGGPKWSIRVSLANLNDEQYVLIGKGINELFYEYHKRWKELGKSKV